MSCSFIWKCFFDKKKRIKISLFNYSIYTNSTINVCISQIWQTCQCEYSLLVSTQPTILINPMCSYYITSVFFFPPHFMLHKIWQFFPFLEKYCIEKTKISQFCFCHHSVKICQKNKNNHYLWHVTIFELWIIIIYIILISFCIFLKWMTNASGGFF
jgi:hypothetical protein